MSSTYMTWEDDDNYRQVRFRVDYTIGNSEVEVKDVVPTEIAFANNTIGVHTEKGRLMLKTQLLKSGRLETLATEVAEKENLFATA